MRNSFTSLRREIRAEIKTLLAVQGFKTGRDLTVQQPVVCTKERVRRIHRLSRIVRLKDERKFVAEWFPRVSKYFASGHEVHPRKIDPLPVIVGGSEEYAALFRIASLWWSVPVSRGFGRRFRILIFDKQNSKLFGLLGLTDPVFNLRARDSWVGWDVPTRERMLRHVMDAYVLGAVPPYNQLLGAKLVGLLAASDFIRQVFKKRYRNTKSEILGRSFDGRLAMLTTASALGRSSIYNRLRIDGNNVFELVGRTEGYGHFHLANGTFEKIKALLELAGDEEARRYKFGNGPNYRMRVARRALELMGLPGELLRHGIRREIYAAPLAENSRPFLRGEDSRLNWRHRPLNDVIDFWRERWLMPRAKRDDSYRDFDSRDWWEILGLDKRRALGRV